jgi:hypothetical protein
VLVVVERRRAGEVPDADQLVVAERQSGEGIAEAVEAAARVRVVVPVPAHVRERRMVVVDPRVDDADDDALALRGAEGARGRPVPDAGGADPRRPRVGLELPRELLLHLRDARDVAEQARLLRGQREREAVVGVPIREARSRRPPECGRGRVEDGRLLAREVLEIRLAGRARGIELHGTRRRGARGGEAEDAAAVARKRRIGELDDVAVGRRRGARLGAREHRRERDGEAEDREPPECDGCHVRFPLLIDAPDEEQSRRIAWRIVGAGYPRRNGFYTRNFRLYSARTSHKRRD